MNARFEELAWQQTPMGAISARRRWDPVVKTDVYEIKLDDEFLMSSLFTAGEIELARLGLAAAPDTELDVLVGGLGLGYTARAALEDPRVRSLTVVEALAQVIEWHADELLPNGADLSRDPRCRLLRADFFAVVAETPPDDRRLHAILLDIDHSPRHLLHPSHAACYSPDGLRRLARHLHPGGVFALWSNDPPDDAFTDVLTDVFADARAHVVTFPNPFQDREATNTVYVARRP